MSTDDTAHIGEKADAARKQLESLISEMHAVLAEDLPAFPAREGKKRFLDAAERATEITDDEIAALKTALREVAEKASAQVVDQLRARDPWLSEGASPGGEARVLDGNPAVTEALGQVARATHEVLEQCGLASADEPVCYRTPTWFIGGRYMPGLIEKYWKHLAQLQEIEKERAMSEREVERRSLAQRWEEA